MFSNLTSPQNIKPGISTIVYVAPLAWFTSVAQPEPPFDAPGEEVLITGNHTFKSGKGFLRFLLAPQKNKLDAKMQGELGLNSFAETAEIFLPGSYAVAFETVKNLLNIPLIALIKDCDCPDEWHYNLGCDCVSCWLTADFSTGTTKDGVKGFAAVLHTTGSAVLFYNGAITLLPAEDPETLYINGQGMLINNNPLTLNN